MTPPKRGGAGSTGSAPPSRRRWTGRRSPGSPDVPPPGSRAGTPSRSTAPTAATSASTSTALHHLSLEQLRKIRADIFGLLRPGGPTADRTAWVFRTGWCTCSAPGPTSSSRGARGTSPQPVRRGRREPSSSDGQRRPSTVTTGAHRDGGVRPRPPRARSGESGSCSRPWPVGSRSPRPLQGTGRRLSADERLGRRRGQPWQTRPPARACPLARMTSR